MAEGLAILVVEDEHLLVGPIEDTLSSAGFEMDFVASGEEALVLLKGQNTAYRALVTDVNLGGKLTGWDVARTARHLDPSFPVIYMTGANGADWAAEGVPQSILLEKPFAPAQLVTAISQLLNKDTPAS